MTRQHKVIFRLVGIASDLTTATVCMTHVKPNGSGMSKAEFNLGLLYTARIMAEVDGDAFNRDQWMTLTCMNITDARTADFVLLGVAGKELFNGKLNVGNIVMVDALAV